MFTAFFEQSKIASIGFLFAYTTFFNPKDCSKFSKFNELAETFKLSVNILKTISE